MCPPLSRRDNELAVCARLSAANRSHPTISLIVPIRPDRAASLLTPSAASPVLPGTRPLFLDRSSPSFSDPPYVYPSTPSLYPQTGSRIALDTMRIYSDTPVERLPPIDDDTKHIHPSPIFLRKTTHSKCRYCREGEASMWYRYCALTASNELLRSRGHTDRIRRTQWTGTCFLSQAR
jgi:hypothetical protein